MAKERREREKEYLIIQRGANLGSRREKARDERQKDLVAENE